MKINTYTLTIILLMFVLPILSVANEVIAGSDTHLLLLIGKWFVFWGIGVRLLTAGIRQVLKPDLTSDGILGIKGKEAWQLVRELGFANIGIGLIGFLSLNIAGWSFAAGLAGGLFLLFAGIEHVRKKNRNSEETLAMVSDLIVGLIGLSYAFAGIIHYIGWN